MRPLAKMPTTLILLCFSWLIAIVGFAIGIYAIFTNGFHNPQAFIISLIILLGSLFLSTLVRMISNIGQMLFDIKSFLYNNQQVFEVKDVLDSQSVLINDMKALLKMRLENISNDLKTLLDLIKQTNCDSKDIDQNIYQIRNFFEQIERHLDLKK